MQAEICKRHNVDHTGTYCGGCFEFFKKQSIKLKKENAALKARLEEAEKALRFYADFDNWKYNNETLLKTDIPSDIESVETVSSSYVQVEEISGKRAREYFKKYEGEK